MSRSISLRAFVFKFVTSIKFDFGCGWVFHPRVEGFPRINTCVSCSCEILLFQISVSYVSGSIINSLDLEKEYSPS